LTKSKKENKKSGKLQIRSQFYPGVFGKGKKGKGPLKSRGSYKNGKKEGLHESFHNNGKLFENGTLHEKGSYKNGKKEGLHESFHRNGQLQSRVSYKNGKKEGLYESFYDYPVWKEEKGKYKNGKKEGLWEVFSGDELGIKERYKKGKKEGPYESFHRNGKLHEKGSYKNGKKEGRWKILHDNGQLECSAKYKNGEKEGLWEVYGILGSLVSKGKFKKGKKEGFHENYFPLASESKISSKGNYKNGEKEGLHEIFHANGKLYEKGSYKNGKKEGLHEIFHANGTLKANENYKKGKKEGLHETLGEKIYKRMPTHAQVKVSESKKLKVVVEEKLETRQGTTYEIGKTNSFNGYAVLYYHTNGQVREREAYEDGKRRGLIESFYDDGKLESLTRMGEVNVPKKYLRRWNSKALPEARSGFQENFDRWDSLASRGLIKNGKQVGTWEYFTGGKKIHGNTVNKSKKKPQKYTIKFKPRIKDVTEENLEMRDFKRQDWHDSTWKPCEIGSTKPFTGGFISDYTFFYHEKPPKKRWANMSKKKNNYLTRINYENGRQIGFNETFYKNGHLRSREYEVDNKHGERLGTYYENFHENGHLASRGWIDGYEGMYWGTWDYFSHWGHLIRIEQHGGEPKDFDRKAFFA
tara:strand:- start:1883 stop:3796 length:1914 start_codon:yes stop_codon:yes gene_type:complete